MQTAIFVMQGFIVYVPLMRDKCVIISHTKIFQKNYSLHNYEKNVLTVLEKMTDFVSCSGFSNYHLPRMFLVLRSSQLNSDFSLPFTIQS